MWYYLSIVDEDVEGVRYILYSVEVGVLSVSRTPGEMLHDPPPTCLMIVPSSMP
jgi:hypothetical protein